MRSGVLTSLVVVGLYACVTPAEQPVQSFPGDIILMALDELKASDGWFSALGQNVAEPWNPGTHLLATWESISSVRTHRIYNPAGQPPREPEGPGWSLSLAGQIAIVDSSGLIGLSTIPAAILALDQDARVIWSESNGSLRDRSYRAPHYLRKPTEQGERIPEIQPYAFSVNLPVGPGTTYPQVLGTLEWSMHALVADQFTNVDIPFQAGQMWVQLVPGLEILVEQAVAHNTQNLTRVRVANGQYQYRLRARHADGEVFFIQAQPLPLQAGQTPPRVIVVDVDVVDEEGRSIRDRGDVSGSVAFGSGGTGGQITTIIRGTANGPACGTAATFRFKLALNAYARHIRFLLENVPMPSFRD